MHPTYLHAALLLSVVWLAQPGIIPGQARGAGMPQPAMPDPLAVPGMDGSVVASFAAEMRRLMATYPSMFFSPTQFGSFSHTPTMFDMYSQGMFLFFCV